jgi:CBS domain containing-hemolysin-like protein
MNGEALIALTLKVLLVAALVLMNGFFVAAEFALVRIRETQLDALALKGQRRAKVARHVIGHLNAYLSATQLGITIASLGLGWVSEPVFHALLAPLLNMLNVTSQAVQHSVAFAVGFSTITFLHIVAGELTPKWLAIRKPLAISLWVARPLRWFYLASYPFHWLLNHAAQWLMRQLGAEAANDAERIHSEEELRLLFTAAQKRAGGTKLGRDIVLNALDLRQRTARDVMRPRQEIVVLDTKASIAECLDVAEKTRYSRFPLCEGGDLDKTRGVIHIKDLYATRLKAQRGADLLPRARKLIYAPETARLEKLLDLLLQRGLHMTIVVDEYGGTTGMLTLENILEELVGQVQDEFHQEKPMLTRTSDTTWEIAGALPLYELADLMGQPLQMEGIATVSGLVTHHLGGFPKAGDTLKLGSFELRVEEMDGMRIARLCLVKLPEEKSMPDSPMI